MKVLIIGPIPEPTTGVSLANKILLDNLEKENDFEISKINTSFNKFDEKLGAFSFSKFFFYFKLNFFVYKIFKVDTVYITPGQTFFGVVKYAIFIVVSAFLKKELIVHVHGNHMGTEYDNLTGLKKIIFKYLLGKTSKGIVLSESLIGNMNPFIEKDKIFILYNFVEDYLFSQEEKTIKNHEEVKIVFLSNLMEEKGIFDLLDALKILEEEGFPFQARIAGNIDTIHKEKIENYFNSLKNVTYCGVVRSTAKKALLSWGDIFVLPTYYKMEGQPISIMEAMATENIILTTKHAGIPDIFEENKNGFFVKIKSPDSIVEKIKFIQKNKEYNNKIVKNNYQNASQKYTVKNFISNAVKIFKA